MSTRLTFPAETWLKTMDDQWRSAEALRGVSPSGEAFFLRAAVESAARGMIEQFGIPHPAVAEGGSAIPALWDLQEDHLPEMELLGSRRDAVICEGELSLRAPTDPEITRRNCWTPDESVDDHQLETARTTATHILSTLRDALPLEMKVLFPDFEGPSPCSWEPWIRLSQEIVTAGDRHLDGDPMAAGRHYLVARLALQRAEDTLGEIATGEATPAFAERRWRSFRQGVPGRLEHEKAFILGRTAEDMLAYRAKVLDLIGRDRMRLLPSQREALPPLSAQPIEADASPSL